jgi:hypothetical protein
MKFGFRFVRGGASAGRTCGAERRESPESFRAGAAGAAVVSVVSVMDEMKDLT